ncbi:diguanylate phosphodiesterase [Pseudomonas sp. RIT623]|uniref:diguanylate phosphodiesterase n=1 Tax=Pseudomonas sp. RIT623 TaxID=2559075 RepID=UPI00142F45D1|nr:diguanylate phosphodiesterase [Pseudomonas sp. RIT623]
MAPAVPVFAGKPAPTPITACNTRRSQLAGEPGAALHGTGCAGVRRQAGSYADYGLQHP